MKISKLIAHRAKEVVSAGETPHTVKNRCTGHSTGVALAVIGEAMQKPETPVYLPRTQNPLRTANLRNLVQLWILKAGIQHLEILPPSSDKCGGDHKGFFLYYDIFTEVPDS